MKEHIETDKIVPYKSACFFYVIYVKVHDRSILILISRRSVYAMISFLRIAKALHLVKVIR